MALLTSFGSVTRRGAAVLVASGTALQLPCCVRSSAAPWRSCAFTPRRANSSSLSSANQSGNPIDSVRLLKDEVVYKGWRTVKRRTVSFPDGSVHEFDVTDAPPAVLCLPYNSKTKTFTLLREYCPGPHCGMFCVVAGLLEPRHQSVEHCVACETEEEAGVRGGRLVPIMENANLQLPGAKYTAQPFLPFLVIDGQKVSSDRLAADADELIETHEASTSEALDIVYKGQMTSTGSMMVLLGIHKLRQMGLL
ncbi:uncharacterized protein LOC34622169 [Cyclospora cayetanensis]|uniref:Uncharacterized protein LOC34622169 n=2 Tax=Cyclospora cayetanensis TaxID=88456 RepID=A0A6P5WG97_9EIME|nr:uncharacterized protein LOC34622169 [Cyclospora cayetanensis]OEH80486.1 nudix domain-containing protein [Cyclospora cayetanensis]